jgi:hypothetical protein
MPSAIPDVWTVYGKAFLSGNTPFSQGKIKVFDVSLEGSQSGQSQLGETGFSHDGSYTITYSRWNFQQGDENKTHPVLQVRIYDYQERLLWQSSLIGEPNTNQLVDAHLSGSTPVNDIWVVQGGVRSHDGTPMTSGMVFAYDNADASYYLGQSLLNSSGFYSISYNKAVFQRGDSGRLAPNLMLRLKNADGLDIAVREESLPSAHQTINFQLLNEPTEIDDGSSVFGQVVNRKNLPLKERLIKAYAMNFTSETSFKEIFLGEASTNEQGRYVIHYNPNLFSSFAKAAIYAVMHCYELKANSTTTYTVPKTIVSPLVYGAERHQVFNFVFDDESVADVTEFAELDAVLKKYLTAILENDGTGPSSGQQKLEAFLKHPTRLQLAASIESKDTRYVDCYFRAFLVAYELQERFAVAENSQTLSYPDGKYDALNYVEFFYALLRTGIISGSSELLKQNQPQLLVHLLGAVSEQIIAADSNVKEFIDIWHEMFQTLSGDSPSLGEWTMYHILLLVLNTNGSLEAPVDTAVKNLIADLLGKFYDAGSDARLFLESVRPASTGSLLDEAQWRNIELLLDLGDFCENYRDIIQASFLQCGYRSPKITSLEGMLVFSESDWANIVSQASGFYCARTPNATSALPPEFIGANNDEQKAIYARKLYKGLLAWFPQSELAANIGQELSELPNPPSADEFAEWQAVSEFLSNANNPPYYLDSTNLGVYLQEHPGIELADGVQQKIRWVQRLFRLTEYLPSVVYLISRGIESAYQIAQMSEERFLADFSVGLGGMNKARQLHRLAVNYTMDASFQISQYHSGLAMQGESTSRASSENYSLPAIQRGLTANGPAMMAMALNTNLALPRISGKVVANWKSLFGTINRNAAIKGQSLLSPSAYLVDLLEFLKEGDGYNLLTKRRPDILNLELSKENAEVSLPMIDLAIELLEKLVPAEGLPSAMKSLETLANQTLEKQPTWNDEDLRAQPEHDPSTGAAGPLLDAPYPFVLPTNFSREESYLMLEKRGLSWRDLALAFPAAGNGYQRRYLVTDDALDNVLRLNTTVEAWELWGLKENGNNLLRPDKSTPEKNKSWSQILSVASIFLDRSGLTLEGLDGLLALPMFTNSGVGIHASAEAVQLGDINGYELRNINADFARKISRLVRLQRLLGWAPEELDAAWELSLDDLDRVQDLSKTLKIPVMQVIFWRLEMPPAMLAQTFWPLTFDTNVPKDVFAEWVRSRLGISQADLDSLLKYLGLSSEIAASVSRSDAEQFYRLNSFAKAIKLSISDFLDLADWFSPLLEKENSEDENYLVYCQQFYALVQELQTNPLSYSDIKQLVFAPNKALLEKGANFILKLGETLDAIRESHEIPDVSDKPHLEGLQTANIACLAILGIDETEMVFLIQSVDEKDTLKNWLLPLIDWKTMYSIEKDENVAGFIDENILSANTVAGRLDALLSSLTLAVQKQFELAMETEVLNQLTSHFSLTEEVTQRLLQDKTFDDQNETDISAWLRSVNAPETDKPRKAAWEDWMAVTKKNAIEESGASLAAYMRLAKAAILVSSLKLNAAEQLDNWMPGNIAGEPWPNWNDFPILEDAKPIDWDKFQPLLQALKVLKDLNFQNEGYESLVTNNNGLRLKKWNLRQSDLNALLAECGLDGNENAAPAKWMHFSQQLALFRKSSNLPTVLKKVLEAIPVSANGKSDASTYIATVASLRKNIRESMSSASWREWIQPVSDGLRIRKRDALAAYVCWCSQQPETAAYYPVDFFDTNDLYAYYLTDVEMQPDMSTSRIRQALNSVQQFVQRAQLGLEGRFALTDDQKSYWEWMKNYRVWEANRKVFLYAENWIEAELRDDKTPFFKELEDKLMETSDNPDAMEEALSEYLEKMLDVGSLQILGACKEDGGNGGAIYTLHIVGRTKGTPGTLYCRRYLAKALHSGEWTPWKKIDAEVQAKSLSMAIMNGNLYLFWPDIQHKEEEAEGYEGDTVLGKDQAKSILELRLNWIYFNGKKWSGKKTTKSVLSHILYDGHGHKLEAGESYEDRFHFRTMNNSSDFLEVKVYRTWYDYDILKPKTLKTKVMDNTLISKEVPVYQPSEFQMIEEFGEFQLWKDGRDQATYYGGVWNRKNSSNYANFYPPANCSLVHNLWADDGEQKDGEDALSVSAENAQDREPQSQQGRRHGLAGSLRFKKLWTQWRTQYSSWRKREVKEALDLERTRERIANLVEPSEAGKLVYPGKNIILRKIDGPYSLYPVNFSFYTGEKLPFFFMGEDKTYLIEEVARAGGGQTAYRFNLLTHPLVDEFHKRYQSGGREWLYTRETEALPMAEGYYRSYSYYNYYFSVYLGYSIAGDWEAWDLSQSMFDYRHQPANGAVTRPFPSPVVDFTWGSANGIYNWELFFHVPMLVASKLTQEQRYEEAMDWMHMVFDPRMDLSVYERTKRWAQALPKGSRFWRFLPFFANKDADANILETLGMPGARDKSPERDALEALIDKWKHEPFNPHLIARARPAAYQKYVVMKYLDNLIAWADQLFTIDTMESLNEAIQLYMLAADILGPKEAATTEVSVQALNVKTLMNQKQEALGNVMIRVEDDLIRVNDREKTVPQPKLSAEAGQLVGISSDMFYFGVPRNEKLQGYWGTVADRLYKIRNSLNIDGVKRTLALYEPPIDPAMLVRARAMGLDISSVLSAMNAPAPLYRFQVMVQKAMDIARDVQSLGASLLSALEKKDGESLSLLRAEHEREMLTLNKGIRQLQIDEANAHLESLQKNRESAEVRYNFYKDIEKYSSKEDLAMILTRVADGIQYASASAHLAASIAAVFPNTSVGGVINAFGGPQFDVQSGGDSLSNAANCVASALQLTSQICRSEASMALTQAGYERRWKEWKLQEKLAKMEMESLDKQILASEIRIYVAEKELENLERQMEQSDEIYEFMTSRFTSRELYTWMATQLGNLHKDTFQQALKAAQRAECCYQFELGIVDSYPPFIKLNYWDGLRQGLLAGECLLCDLRRMESSFLEKNKRELEITRPVSLMQLNPRALRNLQEKGECTFKVPEVLFDMDFPGQYFRRIQSVRLEIHCNAEPYASVSAKLSLLNNRLRKSDTLTGDYENPINYLDNRIGIRSIATSQAQQDSGLFDLNFRDERYLPFEGAGAISEWRLELPGKFRQFDYRTISNVVLHISYTARDSGGMLKNEAIKSIANMWNTYKTLSGEGLVQEIHLGRDYSDALQQLRAGQRISLQVNARNFPAFTQEPDLVLNVQSVRILATTDNQEAREFELNIQSNAGNPQSLTLNMGEWKDIDCRSDESNPLVQDEWTLWAGSGSENALNNLGDIVIEYRYIFGED